MKYSLTLVIAALIIFSTGCKKELSLEGQELKPELPEEPVEPPVKTFPKFQLKAFYSDIPIDFDETDGVVKLETDLWEYVQDYIKDDVIVFLENDSLEIHQNEKKLPGLEDAVLYRSFSIFMESSKEFMNYLTPAYAPLKYRLYEMTEDHFIIGLKWKDGAYVFSRFAKVP